MPGRHAILSPSSANRWLACTPSARFEEQIPEQESVYAAEGTLAHDLAALVLAVRSGKRLPQTTYDETLSRIMKHELYAAEMYDHAEAYADFVLSQYNSGDLLIEQELDLTKYIPLSFGTTDSTAFSGSDIYVTDYKYGAGVAVSATANKQLMCYALGAHEKAIKLGRKPKNVTLSIFQPRAGGASCWTITVADLLKWAEDEVKSKAALAIAGAGEFKAGKHCQFCKARTRCKAYYECFAELKGIRDSREMTDEETAKVLKYGPLVSSWVDKIKEESIEKLTAGKSIPGFKLVEGRGRRSFKDEYDVIDILLGEGYDSDKIFDTKLRSLTDIEKTVGPKQFKTLFADRVINVPGKPQIAPTDDKRPAIGASAADEYQDEELT